MVGCNYYLYGILLNYTYPVSHCFLQCAVRLPTRGHTCAQTFGPDCRHTDYMHATFIYSSGYIKLTCYKYLSHTVFVVSTNFYQNPVATFCFKVTYSVWPPGAHMFNILTHLHNALIFPRI